MSEDDRRSFRAAMGGSLREVVKEAARLDDAAELEQFGGELLPVAVTEIAGMAEEAVAAIAGLPGALTLLTAIEAAAPPPVSTLAAEASARLGPGPMSVAAGQVGTLVPERAWELDLGEAVTSVLVECRRPGDARSQVLGFTLEWPLTGGAIKDGFVSGPVEGSQVDERFLTPVRAGGIAPSEIRPAAAIELVADGAMRGDEAAMGPTSSALLAVTLLLRAGGRVDADELIEPLLGLPSLDELDDDVLDDLGENALEAEVDRLVAALDGWCVGRRFDDARRDLASYAGGCMADFRAHYLDGDLADWDAADLDAFLLDYAPRKLSLEPEDVERFPDAVADVLTFLGETGELDPVLVGELVKRTRAARAEFVKVARDPSSWGIAKGMFAAMSADGVDPTDQDAVQAWIDVFNEQTIEEREQQVPALGNLPQAPVAGGGDRKRKSAAKAKKAQRQARKRNRRR